MRQAGASIALVPPDLFERIGDPRRHFNTCKTSRCGMPRFSFPSPAGPKLVEGADGTLFTLNNDFRLQGLQARSGLFLLSIDQACVSEMIAFGNPSKRQATMTLVVALFSEPRIRAVDVAPPTDLMGVDKAGNEVPPADLEVAGRTSFGSESRQFAITLRGRQGLKRLASIRGKTVVTVVDGMTLLSIPDA